jgi:hypothetical protein
MILGSTGKLPGPLAPEIIALAKEQGRNSLLAILRMNIPMLWMNTVRK